MTNDTVTLSRKDYDALIRALGLAEGMLRGLSIQMRRSRDAFSSDRDKMLLQSERDCEAVADEIADMTEDL